ASATPRPPRRATAALRRRRRSGPAGRVSCWRPERRRGGTARTPRRAGCPATLTLGGPRIEHDQGDAEIVVYNRVILVRVDPDADHVLDAAPPVFAGASVSQCGFRQRIGGDVCPPCDQTDRSCLTRTTGRAVYRARWRIRCSRRASGYSIAGWRSRASPG